MCTRATRVPPHTLGVWLLGRGTIPGQSMGILGCVILDPFPRPDPYPHPQGRGDEIKGGEFSHVRKKTAREGRKEKGKAKESRKRTEEKKKEEKRERATQYSANIFLQLHLNVDSSKRRNKEMTED